VFLYLLNNLLAKLLWHFNLRMGSFFYKVIKLYQSIYFLFRRRFLVSFA